MRNILVKLSKRFPRPRLREHIFLIFLSSVRIGVNGKAAVFDR